MLVWSKYKNKTNLRFIFMIGVRFCFLTLVSASDDEYLRALQEDYLVPEDTVPAAEYESSGNGSCVPNSALTGFVCNDVKLASAELFGDTLTLMLDYETEFNESDDTFQTLGVVSVSFAQVSDQVVANISFNSSTPNGTIVSQGRSALDGIVIETNNVFFPTLPITVEIEHVSVLHRLEEYEGSCDPGVFCDDAVIYTDIGLFANGQKTSDRIEVTANVSEPNATRIITWVSSRVTNETMCSDLRYNMTFRDDLEADIEVCIPGLNCFNDDQTFSPDNVSRTIMDNQCFNRSAAVESR